VKAPQASAEVLAAVEGRPRVYTAEMPRGWWLRQRHYFLYMVREFTSVPLALWLLWFLVEVQRASNGPKGYAPHSSTAFVIFSAICLGFGLYHSVTFLRLFGVVTHIKGVPSGVIVLSQFALWLVASVVIAAVLIGFAR
jgi:fumarate reductase subunit C